MKNQIKTICNTIIDDDRSINQNFIKQWRTQFDLSVSLILDDDNVELWKTLPIPWPIKENEYGFKVILHNNVFEKKN